MFDVVVEEEKTKRKRITLKQYFIEILKIMLKIYFLILLVKNKVFVFRRQNNTNSIMLYKYAYRLELIKTGNN